MSTVGIGEKLLFGWLSQLKRIQYDGKKRGYFHLIGKALLIVAILLTHLWGVKCSRFTLWVAKKEFIFEIVYNPVFFRLLRLLPLSSCGVSMVCVLSLMT